MLQSDLEALCNIREKHRQCLQSAEDIRRMRLARTPQGGARFRLWLGTQLIILGTKLKG